MIIALRSRKGPGAARPPEHVAAQVFLRSVSGRSVRSLGWQPLPGDLAPLRAPEKAQREVRRTFEELGFRTHMDAMGLTLSIEGPAALFAKVFRVPAARARRLRATDTVSLSPPDTVRHLVEDIVLIPRPEFF